MRVCAAALWVNPSVTSSERAAPSKVLMILFVVFMVQMVFTKCAVMYPHKRDFAKKRAREVAFMNPKGIQIYQPKVAELARLPWVGIGFLLNPNGVASDVSPQFLIQLLQSWFNS